MDPVSTSIHTWELIRQARQENGAQLVVVDPYRSRTAAYADLHLRPHAGTDGALALAVGHVIVRDELHDDEYVAARTTDFDDVPRRGRAWTPERAGRRDRRRPPRRSSSSRASTRRRGRPRSAIGVGMQRAAGAGSALRAIQCLTALTGQWRWPAGGISMAVSIGDANLGALTPARPRTARHTRR